MVTTKQDQDAMMAAVQKEQPKVGPKRGRGRGRGGPGEGEQETGRGRATGRGRGGRGRGGRGVGKPEEPKAEETASVNGERPKKKAKVAAEGKATKDQKSEGTPSAKKKPGKASAANASSALVPAEPSVAPAAGVASGNPSKRRKKKADSGVPDFAHVELSIYWTKHMVGLKPKTGSEKGKQAVSLYNGKGRVGLGAS